MLGRVWNLKLEPLMYCALIEGRGLELGLLVFELGRIPVVDFE